MSRPHDTLAEWEYCISAMRARHISQRPLTPAEIVELLGHPDEGERLAHKAGAID